MPDNTRPHEMQTGGRVLTKQEVCERLHLSYPTVWLLVKSGELPPGRYIAAKVYWLESEIDLFIASRPKQGTDQTAPGRVFTAVAAATAASVAAKRRRYGTGHSYPVFADITISKKADK